ncbi:MAG: DUF5117 domain-containing protein [Bacteroidetes bacterium]|nr:MAG: DUF5117 domain-containing protein [Bacteroidota bacterium]
MRLYRWPLIALIGGVLLGGCTASRQASTATSSTSSPAARQETRDDASPFKPYDEIITDEAETDPGLFTVHTLDDKLYYEIPDSLLDREMLLVTRIARTMNNLGYGGEEADNHVVRWQRKDDRILLRIASYENVASEDKPIYEAVRNSNFEPIIAAFDIEALTPDSAGVVIEVTDLFTEDVPAIGLPKSRREAYQVRRLDGDRTFIDTVRSYPENIEVRHVLTYEASRPPSNNATNTISVEMNQSMVLLPAVPMKPRLYDERVGYFSIRQTDYGLDAQRAEQRRYIVRWRLECAGPRDAQGLCEPKKPIVYYIDPATPEKWRPYLKQGVEDWQVAFEAAGFKNAILAKDPPSPEEDPEFSPEDVRYSVIRYFSSPIQNAYGPNVHDPRSGEILESDIGWFHNVMNLLRNWYFVQTAAANPEARAVQFDDAVMGELIRFVSAHEVGHTLGLPHNWGSSYAYPVDSLRSPTFTATHGTAPSIMDYARFNYVAQPGDGVTNFMPRVGEYDVYSIMWGYTPLDDAATPDEERPTLNAWITERADDPRFFYGRQSGARVDPRSQNEDLTNDAVAASELGLANLQRIVPKLIAWTTEPGRNYEQLEELYGQVVAQWNRYLGHVGRNIGGVYETFKTADQDGVVYEPVPEARQRAAMTFLQEQAFATPTWLIDEAILRRIEGVGALDRIRALQVGVIDLLLDEDRLERMIEHEAMLGDATYTLGEMLADLRTGIWAELQTGAAIDVYRRNLQRGYLDRLEALMENEELADTDVPAYVRGELVTLRQSLTRARSRTADRASRLHIEDALARIETILDPDA